MRHGGVNTPGYLSRYFWMLEFDFFFFFFPMFVLVQDRPFKQLVFERVQNVTVVTSKSIVRQNFFTHHVNIKFIDMCESYRLFGTQG